MAYGYEVILSDSLFKLITGLAVADQIVFDGSLVRPLRKRGFEFVYEVFLSSTPALSIIWIEPTEDMSFQKANAILSLQGRNVHLQVDCYEDGSIWLSGA